MSVGSFIKKIGRFLFSSTNAHAFEEFALSEVQQVVSIIAPAVVAPLQAIISTLTNKQMPGVEKLEAVAVEAIKVVAATHGITLSKDIAIALAQKVYTDAQAAVTAEAKAILAQYPARA